MSVGEVERALLALDKHERAALLRRGLQSLDFEDENVDQTEIDKAWHVELKRRIDDINNGRVTLVDLDESHAELRAELAARRT